MGKDLAIKIGREIRVRMKEWDVSTGNSETRDWDEAHHDPVTDEQRGDDYGPGTRPGVEEQG